AADQCRRTTDHRGAVTDLRRRRAWPAEAGRAGAGPGGVAAAGPGAGAGRTTQLPLTEGFHARTARPDRAPQAGHRLRRDLDLLRPRHRGRSVAAARAAADRK